MVEKCEWCGSDVWCEDRHWGCEDAFRCGEAAERARLREAMLHTLNALQSVNNAGQAQDILRQALAATDQPKGKP